MFIGLEPRKNGRTGYIFFLQMENQQKDSRSMGKSQHLSGY